MSYELWFWNSSNDCPHDPDEIVGRLCEGGDLEGLHKLDFYLIRKGLKERFPGSEGDLYESEIACFTLDAYAPYAFSINLSLASVRGDMSDLLYEVKGATSALGFTVYDVQSGEIVDI